MSRDVANFKRVLNSYLAYNKRDQGALLENRASRIRWALRKVFADIAPDPSVLDSELRARMNSGKGIRRGLLPSGKRRSYKQEIASRKRGIKYLSVSWLMQSWKASRTGQNAEHSQTSRTGREIGEAVLKTAKGVRSPRVVLTSLLMGAVIQNKRRGLVSKVMAKETANMTTYIARKQKEEFRKLARRMSVGA